MNKARVILLLFTLTAAAWSFPGLALAKNGAPSKGASMFDGKTASMFDGKTASMFDGHLSDGR
jgi:hypothetical protein